MKKIFTLIFALMAVVALNAQTKLILGGQSANGNWSWGTTQTLGAAVSLHFGTQWGEFVLTKDAGTAKQMKLTVAAPNEKINLVVAHSEGTDTEYKGVSSTEMTIDLSDITNIELQATEEGMDLDIVSCVLVAEDGTETQIAYEGVAWGVSTLGGIYTSTSGWAQIMLNGAEQEEAQKLTFYANANIPEGVQLKVLYTDGSEGYPVIPSGSTKAEVVIENAVKEVSIQFTAADIVLDLNYVTTEPYTSAVSAVNAANTAANCKAYNVVGQRVNSNAKGIVIMNGKKFMK